MGYRPDADLFYGVAWEAETLPELWRKTEAAEQDRCEREDDWDSETEFAWDDDPVNALSVVLEELGVEDLLEASDHGSTQGDGGLFVAVKGAHIKADWDNITVVGALPLVPPEGLKALQSVIDHLGEDDAVVGWLLVASYG